MSRSLRSQSSTDDRKPRKRPLIAEGTRLEVWQPLEQQYVPARLINQRDNDCWKIQYEGDVDHEWILLSKTTFRVLYPEGTPEATEQLERRVLLQRVKVGSRVKVFWKPYNEWFAGTVKKIELGKVDEYLIQYDTKNETWENLFAEPFQLLDDGDEDDVKDSENAQTDATDDEEAVVEKKSGLSFIRGDKLDLSKIKAGMRISVFFKDDSGEKFYDGKVLSDMVVKGKTKRFTTIHFDDGETLDVDLRKTDVRILDPPMPCEGSKKRKSDNSKKPSRKSTNTNETVNSKKRRLGTSTATAKQQSNVSKKHAARLPSQNTQPTAVQAKNRKRATNTIKITTQQLSPDNAKTRSIQANALPPREKTFNRAPKKDDKVKGLPNKISRVVKASTPAARSTVPPRSASSILRHTAAGHVSPPSLVASAASVTDDANPCPICKKAVMERARSLECYHTFCRACIMDKCKSSSNHFCPLCRFSLGESKIHLYNKTTLPEAFRSVVAANVSTSVSRTFATASTATQALKLNVPAKVIVDACNTKDLAHGSVLGYTWTYAAKGISSVEARPCELAHRSARPACKTVDRICVETGKVLESYPSVAEAARKLKISRASVTRAIQGTRVLAGGFSFGSKHSRELLKEGSLRQRQTQNGHHKSTNDQAIIRFQNGHPRAIERLSLKTGRILGTYKSIADAVRALGLRPDDISRVARGMLSSAGGFFFRYAGSTRLPEVESTQQLTPGRKSRSKVDSRSTVSCSGVPSQKEDATAHTGSEVPIEMLCLITGRMLATFDSVAVASADQHLRCSDIRRVLNGHRKSTGNVGFRFKSHSTPRQTAGRSELPVEQMCAQTGRLLARYNSLSHAGKTLKICKKLIARVARGEVDLAGGYFFRFQGSDMLPKSVSHSSADNQPPDTSAVARPQPPNRSDSQKHSAELVCLHPSREQQHKSAKPVMTPVDVSLRQIKTNSVAPDSQQRLTDSVDTEVLDRHKHDQPPASDEIELPKDALPELAEQSWLSSPSEESPCAYQAIDSDTQLEFNQKQVCVKSPRNSWRSPMDAPR